MQPRTVLRWASLGGLVLAAGRWSFRALRRLVRFSANRGRPAHDTTGNRTNDVEVRRGELPNAMVSAPSGRDHMGG